MMMKPQFKNEGKGELDHQVHLLDFWRNHIMIIGYVDKEPLQEAQVFLVTDNDPGGKLFLDLFCQESLEEIVIGARDRH